MTAPASAPRHSRRFTDWAINLALILAFFLGIQWWQGRPLATGTAPPLTGRTLDGQWVDLEHLHGAPVLIHFWATWCAICRLGDRGIDAIAKDHRVMTVAMQSGDAAEVGRFMATAGLSFPVVMDPAGEIARRWGVVGVPATFVLDANGRITHATRGASTETGLRLRLWSARASGS